MFCCKNLRETFCSQQSRQPLPGRKKYASSDSGSTHVDRSPGERSMLCCTPAVISSRLGSCLHDPLSLLAHVFLPCSGCLDCLEQNVSRRSLPKANGLPCRGIDRELIPCKHQPARSSSEASLSSSVQHSPYNPKPFFFRSPRSTHLDFLLSKAPSAVNFVCEDLLGRENGRPVGFHFLAACSVISRIAPF